MKTADYCAALKRRWKITSDYELAKRLGVAKQTVSNYVNGHRVFDNTTAARVAEILELEPMRVIADAELERGSSRELWTRIRDAAAIAGAMIGGAVLLYALGEFNNNGIAHALMMALVLPPSSIHIAQLLLAGAAILTLAAWLALELAPARARAAARRLEVAS